jgi:hypothetical protein
VYLLKQSAKPVAINRKRKTYAALALPDAMPAQMQEEQKQEEGADAEMFGHDQMGQPRMQNRRQKKAAGGQ